MEHLAARVERLVGAEVAGWTERAAPWQQPGVGNDRFTVELADGRRVFAKAAAEERLAGWIRREAEVYAHLQGPFIPAYFGLDDGDHPLLVIEDLSDADWAVRWDDERVAQVRDALRAIAASPPPPNTLPVRAAEPDIFDRWDVVARDPEPFLSVGLRDRAWLERALPVLRDAADAAPVDGDELLHFDVRSDNMCFRDGRAVFVDWNWCCLGNAAFDVAAWAPSLALEGGPKPWEIAPGAGELAAFFAGFWASVVGMPPPPTAPNVRGLQRNQLEVTLEWCERELDLA